MGPFISASGTIIFLLETDWLVYLLTVHINEEIFENGIRFGAAWLSRKLTTFPVSSSDI